MILCLNTYKIVECVLLFLFSLSLIRLALWYKKNELIYPKLLALIAMEILFVFEKKQKDCSEKRGNAPKKINK
jgi:hypothetical protein